MERQVSLEDVFERGCEYIECRYNDDNYCDHDDILEFMTYSKGDDFATCNVFRAKEGFCSECGYRMIKGIDHYPYGDRTISQEYLQCPNCDWKG